MKRLKQHMIIAAFAIALITGICAPVHTVEAAAKKPTKATITSVKSPADDTISVVYKKVSKAKGYQIITGTNKKITKNKKTVKSTKTSANITGLKDGTTYYVKARAYTKSGRKTVYGSWSAVKKVKTAKKAAAPAPTTTPTTPATPSTDNNGNNGTSPGEGAAEVTPTECQHVWKSTLTTSTYGYKSGCGVDITEMEIKALADFKNGISTENPNYWGMTLPVPYALPCPICGKQCGSPRDYNDIKFCEFDNTCTKCGKFEHTKGYSLDSGYVTIE